MGRGHLVDDRPDEHANRLIDGMDAAAKLNVVDRLSRGLRAMRVAGVRLAHPEWNEDRLRREASRSMLEGSQ